MFFEVGNDTEFLVELVHKIYRKLTSVGQARYGNFLFPLTSRVRENAGQYFVGDIISTICDML